MASRRRRRRSTDYVVLVRLLNNLSSLERQKESGWNQSVVADISLND